MQLPAEVERIIEELEQGQVSDRQAARRLNAYMAELQKRVEERIQQRRAE